MFIPSSFGRKFIIYLANVVFVVNSRATGHPTQFRRTNPPLRSSATSQMCGLRKPHPRHRVDPGRRQARAFRPTPSWTVSDRRRKRREPPQHHLGAHQRRRTVLLFRQQQGRGSRARGQSQRLRSAFRPAYEETGRRRRRDPRPTLSRGRIPHRQHRVGERRQSVTHQPEAESFPQRHFGDRKRGAYF